MKKKKVNFNKTPLEKFALSLKIGRSKKNVILNLSLVFSMPVEKGVNLPIIMYSKSVFDTTNGMPDKIEGTLYISSAPELMEFLPPIKAQVVCNLL